MRTLRFAITATIMIVVFMVAPVAGAAAQENNSDFHFRPVLTISLKCFDRKKNSLVWELKNEEGTKIDDIIWIIGSEGSSGYEFVHGTAGGFKPGQVETLYTPVGDLLEVYYDDGTVMESMWRPKLVFWCLL